MAAPVRRSGGPHVPPQPAIPGRTRQPHRKRGIQVERLPRWQEQIKQLRGMKVAGLALAKKRQAAKQAGQPSRESTCAKLAGQEVAIRIIQLRDVKVKKRFLKRRRLPEQGDRDRPSRTARPQGIGPAPARRAARSRSGGLRAIELSLLGTVTIIDIDFSRPVVNQEPWSFVEQRRALRSMPLADKTARDQSAAPAVCGAARLACCPTTPGTGSDSSGKECPALANPSGS